MNVIKEVTGVRLDLLNGTELTDVIIEVPFSKVRKNQYFWFMGDLDTLYNKNKGNTGGIGTVGEDYNCSKCLGRCNPDPKAPQFRLADNSELCAVELAVIIKDETIIGVA